MSQADYLILVDFTGRQIRPDKRGAITGPPPAALRRLGYGSERWTREVMAVGSSFNRAVGEVENLVEKAIEIGQFWLRGVSVARALATKFAGEDDVAASALKQRHTIDPHRALRLSSWLAFDLGAWAAGFECPHLFFLDLRCPRFALRVSSL